MASERAAGDAVQIHGANGYSDEYPVGRFYRNCKGAVIYEGTREIHKLMQADYLLGYRSDRPTRCELPRIRTSEVKQFVTRSEWTPIFRSSSCGSSKQAAIACAHTMGQGDRHGSDQVAVEAMRRVMDTVPIDGTIVIGEGERDEAPMLYIGEKVGMAHALRAGSDSGFPQVDIAVDPLEGTNLCATGAANAIAVLAASHARRPAARARPVHGEAGRRAELEGQRQPRRAGAREPEGDRQVPRARRRGPGRHRARSGAASRS